MLIGLSIKKNETYHYCKPFIFNTFLDKDEERIFIGQILRDVDFSLIVKKNEIIELDILLYKTKNDYYEGNLNHQKSNESFKKLGSYELVIDDFKEMYKNEEFKKFNYTKILNKNLEVEINFSLLELHNKTNEFILSTPMIKGKECYFN